jgi:signal transduction histidine kinase
LRQVLDDVTFMHQLEEEKRRLDRLASLGEMAASVAHEVRNPLASIKTSMQLLKDDLAEDTTGQCAQADGHFAVNEEAQESVTVVLKEVERLDAIVRDLLLFARPRQLHCVVCNLRELSDHVLKVMQSRCAELGVTIQRTYHDVPSVFVDIAQMEQVLFNLYTNALQAMTEGGVLSVSCQVVYTEKATPLPISHAKEVAIEFGTPIGFYRDQQCWLELAVSDTGVGITAEQLKRIFQPFFTTKAHGIGLGLPITRRLIEDHHGHLLVKSQSGHGATFSVRLPLVTL